MYSSEPLPHFIDDYLAYLHEALPTTAAFDGVHTHDDLLEDYSRSAIDSMLRDLGSFGRRLNAIGPDTLTPAQQLERQAVDAHIRARVHDLEQQRQWERNPLMYGETLALSLAAQALFAYAPPEERARRVLSKLRQAPRLLQQARDNVKEPPGIFIKYALETLRGVRSFIHRDLPRAFAAVDDLHLLGDLADASTEAETSIDEYCAYLETELAPRTKGSFRLGKERLEAKLSLEENLGIDVEVLLTIALRELTRLQEEFRATAATKGRDPLDVWREVKQQHPPAGQIVATAAAQLDELQAFIRRQKLLTIPDAEPPVVGPTPVYFRRSNASLWTPGPFEPKPLRTYYYLTDVDPAWSAEKQAEYLRDFSEAALWAISMHEAYPGHFVHFQRIKQLDSPLRRSIAFASRSTVEGWAHYAEHLMIEQGFAKKRPAIKLGQIAEALVRMCRLVVGIRLHAEDLSVEQGVRMFRDEAYLEEASARREAERGTLDPGYVVYALGKLLLLKLRDDVQARAGDGFSLRSFHDEFLGNGLVPFSIHRAAMLGPDHPGKPLA